MKKRKFQDKDYDGNRFFSMSKIDDDFIVELEDLVDIEMIRVGKFNHKIYGDLDITEEMLEAMKDNFENNVVGREISFDWNHKAEDASGWLKELKIEDGVLIGTTELTERGKKSIEKKSFGYFSTEYSDDYVDPETGESHGPTILGGALTNRPFISKLKKIEFSLEDSDVSLYRLEKEEKRMKIEDKDKVVRTPAKKDEDLTLEDLKEKSVALEKENEELKKKLEKIPKDGDTKELQDFIIEQKKHMDEMKKELEDLKKDNVSLQDKHKQSDERAHVIEIERKCDKLLSDDHHHPSVVSVAKQIMLSAKNDDKVIKFEETIGEGENEKKVNIELSIMDAVVKILESIPKTQRANYDEKTVIGSNDVSLTEEEETKLQEGAIKKAFAKKKLHAVK
uniref:Uncharacterized protein n=1 Tax=viral metagenome TaxID=1070528 RepID=A0A6M3JYK0_9ZZZZ